MWLILAVLTSRRLRKIAKSDYYRRIVCLADLIQQPSFHWTDCRDILYLSVFFKSIEKIH